MTRPSGSMLIISMLAFVTGCGGPKEPVAAVPEVPIAEPEGGGDAGTTLLPDCNPAADQYSTVGGPRMRITLNADGSINQIEGKDAENNWEPGLQSQATEPPSVGNCVARIEIYMHDGSETDLKDSNNNSTHGHAIQTNPPYNTHCHKWAYANNTKILVHC